MEFVEHIQPEVHDAFVKQHPLCNLLQSSSWGKVKENWGYELVGVYEQDTLIGSAMVLIKPLPLGFTMLYIPRGPIMDYENKELVCFFLANLKRWAKKKKCLFIKLDPEIHLRDTPSNQRDVPVYPNTTRILQNLKDAKAIHMGYTTFIEETIQPRFQSNVYPCENFEESLPRHTRRLIKDALKRNVQIVQGQEEYIDEFSRLVSLTEERKGVHLRNQEYFARLCEIYGKDTQIFLAGVDLEKLYQEYVKKAEEIEKEIQECPANAVKKMRRLEDMRASTKKDVEEFKAIFEEVGKQSGIIYISGVLSIQYGPVCEMLYAGMDQRFKKFMPQYYLYQENMKWAFAQGCRNCNMGGVEGTLDDGLTKFKDNFNPLINELIGEFDVPVNTLLYQASRFAYKLRKKTLNKG